MRLTQLSALLLISVAMTGCSITTTVEPMKPAQVSEVCVLENKDVLMDGFQPEVQQQIESRNIPTRTYIGARPAECSHYLEYTANWAWDMAMYLTYAEFRVYDGQGIAGSAIYNARHGGGRLDKFGGTAGKIRPLIDQLFGAISVGKQLVPVQPESAITAAETDRSARLKELSHLHAQGLITDDEFTTRRQAILEGL